MNYQHHNGNVTGDLYAQVVASCNMSLDRGAEPLCCGAIGTLDAPPWINSGRMVNVDSDGRDVQFQQYHPRAPQ